MPNNFFQFKQFIIYQNDDVLKVSTDSCLFGAMVAEYLSTQKKTEHILDIGAGTGLLMLMLAQKTESVIDGVEIQEASYKQASSNTGATAWRDRLQLIHTDISDYQSPQLYDFIISNPPFFEEDLHSPNSVHNIAKHDAGLRLDTLMKRIQALLKPTGQAAILLPNHRRQRAIALAAENKLYPFRFVSVRQTPKHSFFRSIIFLSKTNDAVAEEQEITIRQENGNYSEAFIGLLKDYYLHL